MATEPQTEEQTIETPEEQAPTPEQIAAWMNGKSHDDLKGFGWYNAAYSRGEQKGRAVADTKAKEEQDRRVAEQQELDQLRASFEPNGKALTEVELGLLAVRNPDKDVMGAHKRYQLIKIGGGADIAAVATRTADEILKGFTDSLAELPEFEGFDFSALEEELTGETDPKLKVVKWMQKLFERGTGVTRDEMLAAAREAAKEEALAARNEAQAANGTAPGAEIIPGGQAAGGRGLTRAQYGGATPEQREEWQKSGALDAAVRAGTF